MCDFKVGDEVVCIRSLHGREGMKFTVAAVCPVGMVAPGSPDNCLPKTEAAIQLHELPWVEEMTTEGWSWGYKANCFRKAERRKSGLTIESFSTIKPGFEEPRRVPNKTPARV